VVTRTTNTLDQHSIRNKVGEKLPSNKSAIGIARKPASRTPKQQTVQKNGSGMKIGTIGAAKRTTAVALLKSPNLVLGSLIRKGAPKVAPGGKISLQLTVYNKGLAKAGVSELKVMRLPNSRVRSSGSIMIQKTVATLEKGKSRRYRFQVTAPNRPGKMIIGACAKAVSNEKKKSDNCAKPLTVNVQEIQTRRTPQRLK